MDDDCDNNHWKTVKLAIIVSIFVRGASHSLFSVGRVGFYSVQKRQDSWPACYADLGNMLQGNLPTLSKCQLIKRIKCLILREKIGAECLNFGREEKRRSYYKHLQPCWSRVHTSGCWNPFSWLCWGGRVSLYRSKEDFKARGAITKHYDHTQLYRYSIKKEAVYTYTYSIYTYIHTHIYRYINKGI